MQKVSEQKILDNKQLTDEQIEASLKLSRMMMNNTAVMIIIGLAMFAFIGTITGLIVAAICKKESGKIMADE